MRLRWVEPRPRRENGDCTTVTRTAPRIASPCAYVGFVSKVTVIMIRYDDGRSISDLVMGAARERRSFFFFFDLPSVLVPRSILQKHNLQVEGSSLTLPQVVSTFPDQSPMGRRPWSRKYGTGGGLSCGTDISLTGESPS